MNYDEYLQNIKILNKYAYAYYTLDEPIASDDEYDKLYKKIQEYENKNPNNIAKNSPSQRIGGEILDEFVKNNHIAQMWSMEDAFNINEVAEWINRAKKTSQELDFYCEPKFDGASLNLYYENGILQTATSRGDGKIGELVTNNAKTIRSIPLEINYKKPIEIRGEVVIKKADFKKINDQRLKENQSLFANPRNAAAGSLRQLNSSVVAKRNLVFYPWGVGSNQLEYKNANEIMNFIYELGFLKPSYFKSCKNLEQIQSFYEEVLAKREDIEFLMDGIVIKINSISLQETLGYTQKFPRWMLAFKFPATEKTTTLLDIILQVGRSGVITPVAVVEPVNIDGAVVTRATLHNFEEIKRKDIQINDKVIIIRSGDVIPKITKVIKERRNNTKKVQIPTNCPVCGTKLLQEEILIKCQNLDCGARLLNSLIHFASKKCLNIDGLGEKIIKLLFDKKLIKNIHDIYFLKYEDLVNLEGFRDKKIKNLLNAIENSKGVREDLFINSLGIEHIGEVAARKIAQNFHLNLDEITFEKLVLIDGFGQEMAQSVVEFINVNKNEIIELIEIIKPNQIQTLEAKSSIFLNKKVAITGTLSKSRDENKQILESLGANFVNSISKKTDILIYGENAGSKLEKAKELNIFLMNELEYEEALKEIHD